MQVTKTRKKRHWMARRRGSKLGSFGTACPNRILAGTLASCPTHLLAIFHAFLPRRIAFQPEDQVPHESRSSGMNWKQTLSSKRSTPTHPWA